MASEISASEALELMSSPSEYGLITYGGVFTTPKTKQLIAQSEEGFFLLDKAEIQKVGVGYKLLPSLETLVGKLV